MMKEHKFLNSDSIHVNSLIAMMLHTPNDREFGKKVRAYLQNIKRRSEPGELKSSHEWLKEYGCRIIDFEGWDKDRFQFSYFEEKISQKEFEKRLFSSAIMNK